jgi:hypothetical protein
MNVMKYIYICVIQDGPKQQSLDQNLDNPTQEPLVNSWYMLNISRPRWPFCVVIAGKLIVGFH